MAESIVGTPTTSPLKMSDSPDGDGPKVETKAHYDAVKMKYFRSLGMPPAENSSSQPMPIRGRSRTANDTQISPKQFQYPIYASSVPESRQTRSVSTPIPISSEDARSPPSRPFLLDEDDEGGSDGNDGEIDFYAKMQRLHKKVLSVFSAFVRFR